MVLSSVEPGDNRVALACFAVTSTAGAVAWFIESMRRRDLVSGMFLMLVALSPTVFAYVLNLIVLLMAVEQLVTSGVRRADVNRPASRSAD